MKEGPRSDFRDRKDALKANAVYRRALQGIEEGMWTIDATGVTDYINPQGVKIPGYAAEEVLGRSPLTFVVAEDGGRTAAEEARQAATELHELYHNAPFGYHSLDATGVILEINDTELGWLGYAREEVVGKMRITDLMPPERLDWFEQNFARLKERDCLRDLEYEMRRKDGTTFSVLVSAIAVKDSNGQFVRSRASVFDISERKRAASELSESEARNTAILHAALDCIVSIDSHGKIIEFNPAAERTFGYAREQVVGKDVAEIIIPAAMRDAHRRGMKRYLTTGETSLLEKRVQVTAMRSDGSEFPVELTITHVRLRRETIFSAYLRDITKEK